MKSATFQSSIESICTDSALKKTILEAYDAMNDLDPEDGEGFGEDTAWDRQTDLLNPGDDDYGRVPEYPSGDTELGRGFKEPDLFPTHSVPRKPTVNEFFKEHSRGHITATAMRRKIQADGADALDTDVYDNLCFEYGSLLKRYYDLYGDPNRRHDDRLKSTRATRRLKRNRIPAAVRAKEAAAKTQARLSAKESKKHGIGLALTYINRDPEVRNQYGRVTLNDLELDPIMFADSNNAILRGIARKLMNDGNFKPEKYALSHSGTVTDGAGNKHATMEFSGLDWTLNPLLVDFSTSDHIWFYERHPYPPIDNVIPTGWRLPRLDELNSMLYESGGIYGPVIKSFKLPEYFTIQVLTYDEENKCPVVVFYDTWHNKFSKTTVPAPSAIFALFVRKTDATKSEETHDRNVRVGILPEKYKARLSGSIGDVQLDNGNQLKDTDADYDENGADGRFFSDTTPDTVEEDPESMISPEMRDVDNSTRRSIASGDNLRIRSKKPAKVHSPYHYAEDGHRVLTPKFHKPSSAIGGSWEQDDDGEDNWITNVNPTSTDRKSLSRYDTDDYSDEL